jgi:hypothetical protein
MWGSGGIEALWGLGVAGPTAVEARSRILDSSVKVKVGRARAALDGLPVALPARTPS